MGENHHIGYQMVEKAINDSFTFYYCSMLLMPFITVHHLIIMLYELSFIDCIFLFFLHSLLCFKENAFHDKVRILKRKSSNKKYKKGFFVYLKKKKKKKKKKVFFFPKKKKKKKKKK